MPLASTPSIPRVISRAAVTLLLTAGLTALTGCVTRDAYELAKKDAENARLLHQSEQRHSLELAQANKRMKQQIEEMQGALRELRENLARTEREWRETRDELLRIKIEREQRPGNRRDREAQLGLGALQPQASEAGKSPESQRPLSPDVEAGRPTPSSEDVKERLKTVLEQLQRVLQEY